MNSMRTGTCFVASCTLAISLLTAAQSAFSATTDIAQVPLTTSSSSAVKPNIMFILDDSGSMGNAYMPDDANFGGRSVYGKLSPQCNGLAYNPKTSYSLPVDANGNTLAPGSGAFNNSDPTKLTSSFDVTATTITIVPSGDIGPFTISGSPGWTVGAQVTLFNSGDTVRYMTGTVKSFSGGKLTLTVNDSVGSGSLTINKAATNAPTLPYYYAYNSSGSQTAMSYVYTAAGVDKTTTFYMECNSAIGSTPGSTVFTKVQMSAASSDAQNYQNWYTYYRTRMMMMKSAMSIAFKPLTDKYRVGFTTISSQTAAPGTKFLDVNTFDATHKADFYTALNAAVPDSNTPLRGALSKAGQYFANKASGQASDPIQYSCQKNFTILSTDGYWNTGTETATYGPFDVNGNAVGQQDASEDRPMRDSAVASTTTVTTWNTTRTVVTQVATKTTNYTTASVTTNSTYGAGSGTRSDSYASTVGTSTLSATCTNNPKTCTAIVTTSSSHGLSVGSSIYVQGASSAFYNGAFTVSSVVNGTQFKYTKNYSGNSPGNLASTSVTLFSRGTCSAGSYSTVDSWTQTDTFPLTITTTTNATATDKTDYQQTQTVTVTPFTETKIVVNGAVTSDTTAAGTPTITVTNLTPPASTTSAPYAYTNSTSTTGTPSTKTTTGSGSACVATPTNTSNVSVAVVSSPPANNSSTAPTTLASVTVPVTTTPTDNTVTGPKTSTATDSTSGGSSNSLADVAEYYFKTDLRNVSFSNCQGALGSSTDVCGAGTSNPMQNMITFTIGLGTNGTLKYDPNYKRQTSGDYFDLTQGTKNWPIPTDSSSGGDPTNIDDLWHAAVNGRGQYFSAGNPAEVVSSLSAALLQISVITGSGAAAATSTLQPVAGDNDVFVAQFTSGKWTGDVAKYNIDPTTGKIDTTRAAWRAATVLDAQIKAGTSRTIYYFKPGTGNTGSLKTFTYANLQADGKSALFDSFCSKAGVGGSAAPQQCGTFDAATTTTANTGSNLVNYLRGVENATVYRSRDSALGDIINAAPLFVGTPKFKYTENNYASFATSQQAAFKTAGITGVVYVAANDGMLHAFDRATGAEKWAYIPSAVLPNLYKLADTAYSASHQFFVDGSPQMGDIYVGGAWKTILVGGLNAGGRAYYALDVTDPSNPKALWEFTDDNLGLTFGNPIITKRTDGTWVVAFASGYNNVSPGDGNGRLFVLDAATGAKLVTPVGTYTDASGTMPAGSATTPSGLAKINAWIDSDIDNTAKVFYGGDLLGNVWRFDIDSQARPFGKAYLLANLAVSGVPQPITTKPQLAEVSQSGSKFKVIYVGTGRYLGTGDLSNTDLQSVYALKDTWTDTSGLGNVRISNTLVEQKLSIDSSNSSNRLAETNKVDWTTKNGWMVDLKLSSGERVNVNMSLALNVLSVATNVPTSSACDAGGQSWLYKFDIATGSAVSNAPNGAVATFLGNVMVAGQTVVQLADGQTVTISTLSNAQLRTDNQPPPPANNLLRRTSWRELAN